ncbi:serine/threonine-protein kinase [Streptosporangium sandarakinum]|uniref:serine/threonine-protein kinase n=1 Tax=Streptosporangium sandarakinum TaxID=1260955 RepID=UPI0033A7A281
MNQDDRLGPYRLLRRLGEGGMGVVHLATDPRGRQVAVKVLRGEVAGDDVARRRLSREVETMRRVRSEYIAEVVDADVTGHRPYIVTRYVPGRSLEELVKQDGPLDLPALLQVAHGVAVALAAVHSVGVIHRDLKPGNVLILDGRPVLIDFGIAQAVDATRLTQTGMFIGTPGYLAPEIIEGHEAGPEVDVHAWGGTLVFAATGRPPFGKGTLEMIFYNITAGKADVDSVPEPLRPLLRAALQRDPARRPAAAELAGQVGRLMAMSGRPWASEEIVTVPRFGDAGPGGPGAGGSGVTGPAGGSLPGRPDGSGDRGVPGGHGFPGRPGDLGDVPTPATPRPGVGPWPPAQPTQPSPVSPASPAQEYVSLLGEQRPDERSGERRPGERSGEQWSAERPGGQWPAGRPAERSVDRSDPWPTRRVTPEELRRAAVEDAHDLPTGALGPEDLPTGRVPTGPSAVPGTSVPGTSVPGTSGPGAFGSGASGPGASGPGMSGPGASGPGRSGPAPWTGPGAWTGPETSGPSGDGARPGVPDRSRPTPRVPDGDIPTQRVRPQDLREYARDHSARPGSGSGAVHPAAPYPPPVPSEGPRDRWPAPADPFEHTPHLRPDRSPAPPPYPYPHPRPPGAQAGHLLQRSRAHGVAGTMALVAVAAVAVLVPVLAAVVAVPAVILLRAADIAQPGLAARRPAGAAAADVLRVLGNPAALLKAVGVTIALLPYALILGLPVTLLLTVLVTGMPTVNALSWGVAVALWAICAGPGVEGPSRQMRRTLASLLPSRGAAMITAAAVGAAAVLAVIMAAGTVRDGAREARWTPVGVKTVVSRLDELRERARR